METFGDGYDVTSDEWLALAQLLFGDGDRPRREPTLPYGCWHCHRSFRALVTPTECPHCRRPPGNDWGVRLTHKGHTGVTFPFAT